MSARRAPRYRRGLVDLIDPSRLPPAAIRPFVRWARVWGDLAVVPTCLHIIRSQPAEGVYACLHHPRGGVKCATCLERHRHRCHGGDPAALQPLPYPLALDTGSQRFHRMHLCA